MKNYEELNEIRKLSGLIQEADGEAKLSEQATMPVSGYTNAYDFIHDFWFYGHNPSEMVGAAATKPKHLRLNKFLDDNGLDPMKLYNNELEVVLWLAKKMSISPMTVLRHGSDVIRFQTDTIKAVKQKIAKSKRTEEADGSGSYGGQSPLTYEDDELNEIKRLSGLEEAKRKERTDDEDDWDDEDEDEKPEDPDNDKVPHILMQLKKAKDVDGDHYVKFKDGSKHLLPIDDIDTFMEMYMSLRPLDREKLQEVAIMSKEQFDKVLAFFKPDHAPQQKSIYRE